jgi:hypothetical protein
MGITGGMGNIIGGKGDLEVIVNNKNGTTMARDTV